MTDWELGYITGLYEGEGWCGHQSPFYKEHGFTRKRNIPQQALSIKMKDKEPLLRVHQIMGFGRLRGPTKGDTTPMHKYEVTGLQKVQIFLEKIYPQLSPRRQEQACDCLGREYDNDDYYYEQGY